MIGMFPPPLMGMATINLAMKDFISARGQKPVIIDLSTNSLSKAWYVRIRRLFYLPFQLVKFLSVLAKNPDLSIYMGLSGGYGQLLELPFVFLARVAGAKLFLHHHSVLYINHPRAINRLLINTAGAKARHIVLCHCMADGLHSRYPIVGQKVVLSNSAVLPEIPAGERQTSTPVVIGFLSNIEIDKGILEFIEVARRLEGGEQPYKVLMAGPFRDAEIEAKVRSLVADLSSVQYVGPKYGDEKGAYYASIDVLLYPTRNDAEPLIVIEAMAHGVPIIAWNRGCIKEMIASPAGLVIPVDQDYVNVACKQLLRWKDCPEEYVRAVRAARTSYENLRSVSLDHLEQLLLDMTSL